MAVKNIALKDRVDFQGCESVEIQRASASRGGGSDSFAVGGGDPRQARTGASPFDGEILSGRMSE